MYFRQSTGVQVAIAEEGSVKQAPTPGRMSCIQLGAKKEM